MSDRTLTDYLDLNDGHCRSSRRWTALSMPFSDSQKEQIIQSLVQSGWTVAEGKVYAANRELWFDESHFSHWTPAEMLEVFIRRASRIENAKFANWETSLSNHRQVCSALESLQ